MDKVLVNGKEVVKERENGHLSAPSTSKATDKENSKEKFTAKGTNNDEKSDEEEEESVNQDPNMSVMESDGSFNNTHDSGLGTEAEKATNLVELSQDSGHGGEGNAEEVAECSRKSKIVPECLSRKVQVLGSAG